MADHNASSSFKSSYSIYEHDVFLSFRGETRHTFTDHLYNALIGEGIKTFRDDPNLRIGDEIRPTLLEAIERSRTSIVVLSQSYASSSWCLDELTKIMECKNNGRMRRVFPVFYHVEPSDVRHQKNQYGIAMTDHEKGKNSYKVQAWRSALSAVADLSGKHCYHRYESTIIQEIVDDVSKELNNYLNADEPNINERRDVVGFDVLGTIINELKKEDPVHNVVSITGMGGIGKTTLARMIYCHPDVIKLFPLRAWSCVSKDFNGRKVFLELLNSIVKSSTSRYEKLSEEELKEEVRKHFIRNKYLVVLDDIWEPEVWDKVEDIFPDNNNNGSMILLTSRNVQLANYTESRIHHYQLSPLNVEKSWELFCRKVFRRGKCPSDLEPIGKSIVERCGGLPLAIVTIAGLVKTKKLCTDEWSKIDGFVSWHLAKDSTNVINVLKVSYDSLPDEFKPCFRYLGIYPEDYQIVARKLIQLWIAEGFIQPEKTETSRSPIPEDVGEYYLNELVDRNLIQVEQRRSIDGGVKICRIHDLLRELCIIESRDDKFLEVCTESTKDFLSNCYRLSFQCDRGHSLSLIKGNQSSTHSLFFFGKRSYSGDTMKNFPMLYVLHVATNVPFEKVPDDLKKLICLKYLRIQDIPYGDALDWTRSSLDNLDWIWSLDNLETLDLTSLAGSVDLGRFCMWKMERLRHVYVHGSFDLKLDQVNSQRMLNLQTLTMVHVDSQTILLFKEGCFPNLTKLGLFYDSLDKPSSWNLHFLRNLRTLRIDFSLFRSFPIDEIEFPPNISKITLTSFGEIDSRCMSALGRIPSLRVLKLGIGLVEGDTLNCGAAGDFPKLEVFHIRLLYGLKVLTLEDDAMPLLQRLVIEDCPYLKEIPERLLHKSEIIGYLSKSL